MPNDRCQCTHWVVIEQIDILGQVITSATGKPDANGDFSLQMVMADTPGFVVLRARVGPSDSFSSAETTVRVWVGPVVFLPI